MQNKYITKSDIDEILPKHFLNQSIWFGETLRSEVRLYLLLNALEFIEFLNIDNLKINDIILTGSIANYNWNESSDVDLHIVFDFTQLLDDEEFVSEYLRLKKDVWNNKFNPTIKNFNIELYAQNSSEIHHSSGVYSVYNNLWLTKPIEFKESFKYDEIIHDYENIINRINKIFQIEDVDEKLEEIDVFKEWLRSYRQKGLSGDGEISTNNIVFKLLRYNNILNEINDTIINLTNNKLSI